MKSCTQNFLKMSGVYKRFINKNVISMGRNLGFRSFTSASSAGDRSSSEYDIVIVGGGIVGVASAREFLIRHPKLRMAIVEKENKLAAHQTGHNSGVIHAGIYYKPGSLKAKLCVEGLRLMYKYLEEKKIDHKKVGKLIVATNAIEVKRLLDLQDRGIKNNVPDLKLIEGKQIQEIEPFCRGVKALWSPHTGIVDYALVTEHYAQDFKGGGGNIYFNFEVNGFKESGNSAYPVVVTAKTGQQIKAKYVLACGGLYSDKLAQLSGCSRDPRIVPFRGEYLLLKPEKCHMVKGNIYPVPDPRFPFLGVHFTPRMDGSIWLGPNAVLAFKREGYSWFDVNLGELADALLYPGFRKMASRYLLAGGDEVLKSIFTSLQVKQLRRFIADINTEDVTRGPAGVRAQALDISGQLVDDFYFDMGKSDLGKRILHCRNAPSPGATSSLAIAKMISDRLEKEFEVSF